MKDFYFKTVGMNVGYNGEALIKDIEIHLNKGEILTLIGPNGSGKSTILKSITKHLKKLAGTVYIGKNNLDTLSYKEVSTKLAVVLTEKIRPELMTCWDMVATGRYPHTGTLGLLTDTDREEICQALDKVHALDIKDRDFDAISDGQRQRILLAKAICQQPEIIVLDEPTSFLDIRHKLELLNILKDMAQKHNITIIMSLHEIDLAQKISDQVMCVKGEQIMGYGTPKEIFIPVLIQQLYGITNGSYNMTFGSIELSRPVGQAKLFVIAGNGTGIAFFRQLQRLGIAFYVGVLHENDIDYQVAKVLAQAVITEKAFYTITQAHYNEAYQVLMGCDCVLYTGVTFGETNAKNELLLKQAHKLNLPVIREVEEYTSI